MVLRISCLKTLLQNTDLRCTSTSVNKGNDSTMASGMVLDNDDYDDYDGYHKNRNRVKKDPDEHLKWELHKQKDGGRRIQ